MNPITIRKTLARFAYYASKSQEGIEHKTILKSLDFTQDDFQYMIEQSIEIANNDDYDLDVVLTDHVHKSSIGGCFLSKNGKNVAWL
jgi:hypothetical protein